MPEFTHLHVHSQFSILDGAASIEGLLNKAMEYGMDSLALTDHGNLYGALKFVKKVKQFKKEKDYSIKPILGCEIYVARRSRFEKDSKVDRKSFHLILLAKNKIGYHNLAKLSSIGFKREHFYYHPRVDKELLKEYSEGLIASSACLGGEIPSTIMNYGEEKAEEVLQEYLDIFGEDFYLELQNHGLPEQKKVNEVLVRFSRKYNVKLIATNDVHFINKEDYEAHHILICLNTGKDVDDKEGLHYSGEEFLKSPDEMTKLFAEYPEAIANTREIVDKIEEFDITTKKVILPHFPLPEGFDSEDEYLRHLTYQGAEKKYDEITPAVTERLDFELGMISREGFPGYFLIVQDFIAEARKMGVLVGPGRGSAAGSAVAYCTGITNIDPIKYNLLFERFLNPERVSMPDIDIDFDDEGRDSVLKYVINKYGEDHVAQIVTFGTMAARSSIRDVGRVLKLPLNETDRIAKLVPERPGITLSRAFKEVKELADIKKNGPELAKKTLKFAETLEGSNRHTGTHACGVIIGPDNLMEHVPLSTAKDSDLMVTQYEGKIVEEVGMLKMDFLGLKTLSIIKDAIINIEKAHQVKIEVDEIPLDDVKTFELYQRGDTIGTFQFESDGMRKHLRNLKPTDLEDLIAMNALYRPGPMDFIDTYIRRKHGKESVVYPHPLLEELLKPTFGIMVYQEQIMQTARVLGKFTLGGADVLRRAMGKKQMAVMEEKKIEFVAGAASQNIEEQKAIEVFGIMAEFANYGFNRSHAAAYSVVAFQTAYLKAHYPAEYMAAVLTHNLNDIKKITFFIDECRRQNIPVLGPDINESELNFTVNKKSEIRFGMAAIKGIGEAAVTDIIDERIHNGNYTSIFDLTNRINLRSVNKRSLEALALAGAFDSFTDAHTAQYFYKEPGEEQIFLEKVIKHGTQIQSMRNSSQVSLFGEDVGFEAKELPLPNCQPWTRLEKINREKDVIGFYLSGHPLDDYRIEMDNFPNVSIFQFKDRLPEFKNKGELIFGGIIMDAEHKSTQKGNPYGSFIIEDYSDSMRLALFSEDYLKMKHFLNPGAALLIKARVQLRYNSERDFEVKINSIHLLSEVLDKLARDITLKVQIDKLDDDLITKVANLVIENKGKCPIKFHVMDPIEKISVEMPAMKLKVKPSTFVRSLLLTPEVGYKIN